MITIFVLFLLIGIVIWLGLGIISATVACRRGGRIFQWGVFGVLLGPVGLFLVFRVLAHKCPSCNAPVLRAVRICPRCGEFIPRLKHNPVGPFWTYRRDW
jgi:endogenous inhibitor of DNA gyrase (YacG/DUF329 family)